MLRCVEPAGNNGHNILSTEVVFNRFIIGEEKACDTERVQVNILCGMVGTRERSFFLCSQPPPPPHLPYFATSMLHPLWRLPISRVGLKQVLHFKNKNLNIKLKQRCDNVYPRLKWCYTSLPRRSS